MKNLYKSPDLYDAFYDQNNEAPLRKHYKDVLYDKKIHAIMDCSIGTGNLTFVLSDMGYNITGSDISSHMLERAKQKSLDRHIEVDLYEADFRNLHQSIDLKFDCLMSTGNSLAHVNNHDVKKALSSMTTLLNPKGYLYIDTRNWDKILDDHERFSVYNPHFKDQERLNVILCKDYLDSHIDFNFLYAYERDNKIYKKEEKHVRYYPIKKEFLIETLEALGFESFEIFNFINHDVKDFDQMAWYSLICRLK